MRKIKSFLFFIFFPPLLIATTSEKLIDSGLTSHVEEFLKNYSRPVTILYISPKPELIPLEEESTIVYWSKKEKFLEKLKQCNSTNAMLVTGQLSRGNLHSLSECEHFDIAIIDMDHMNALFKVVTSCKAHLADHTFILTKNNLSMNKVGTVGEKNLFLLSKRKMILRKNWWKSSSWHKNYPIKSSFEEKYFVKPAQYSDSNHALTFEWLPGINLCTFTQLSGVYPTSSYLREKVIEVFDPLYHNDFGWANIIIHGSRLSVIDFDTHYLEEPYFRLKRTLELHLKMKYD
ncbi:MAG: hypothetical protein ChlgKO_05450 [Chlamydiales bacterium]